MSTTSTYICPGALKASQAICIDRGYTPETNSFYNEYTEHCARIIMRETQLPTIINDLKYARNKLRQFAIEFNRPNFTDRHGDGPACQRICERINELLIQLGETTW
jgi:hypothetical protein